MHQRENLLKDRAEDSRAQTLFVTESKQKLPAKDLELSDRQSEVQFQGEVQKNLSSFFIGMSVFILIIIAFVYYRQTQKINEKDKARKEKIENGQNQSWDQSKDLVDDILNSGTAKNTKKILILVITIFVMIIIVYSFTLLFKQVKSMEAAVMS